MLTLMGTNFVAGMSATVGDQSLGDVWVQSATALTGTLPPGLCPGTYAAVVSDAQGKKISGGLLTVNGIRDAQFGAPPVSAPTIKLSGAAQLVTVPLSTLQVTDTTCGRDDPRLNFAVNVYTERAGSRFALETRAINLDVPNAPRIVSGALLRADQATATLVVPRAAMHLGASFSPSIEVEIPPNATIGQYVIEVNVTLAAAS